MPSIFLCHSSVDKPFVEKLAKDLKRLGVNVWFDKWKIKVGESLTDRIQEGVRQNEYLAIVLSPDAVKSEWVKCEFGAAWSRQLKEKRAIVLPLLFRDCEIPPFLSDRKYADFRADYSAGLGEVADALGLRSTDIVSIENWRKYVGVPSSNWRTYRQLEFESVVTALVDRAREFNWSTWVGAGSRPFSITLSAFRSQAAQAAVSLRLCGRSYAYLGSVACVFSPKQLRASDFTIYIGNTVNECEEFVWRKLDDFNKRFGTPEGKPIHSVSRFLSEREKLDLTTKVVREFASATSWYKGTQQLT